MIARALRGLFVTVLTRPVDADSLAAALALACGDAAPAREEPEHPGVDAARRRLSVLVAEDNRTNQMVIGKILERAGHRVQLVGDGEAALEVLDGGGFDVVLMDVNMPVMNGIEATKLFRFASLGADYVPIIALTADATAEARGRCEAAGMDACLTKPVEPARLLAVIENLAPRRGAHAEGPEAAGEGVTSIAEHPKFQASPHVCISRQTLDDLKAIGGEEFVRDLAAQFTADAESLLADLRAAAAEVDVEAFRDRAHALRSGAANIGAHGVYDLCVAWRLIGAGELAERGREHVARLGDELERVGIALAAYVAAFDAAEAPAAEVAQLTPLSRPA